MNKEELIERYNNDTISRQQLGSLRRIILDELLQSFKEDAVLAKSFLTKNGNKLDRKKLAAGVGFGIKTVNISQSFKELITKAEETLKADQIIIEKSDEKIRQESLESFNVWLNEKIETPDFLWPVNNKNGVYRRILWSIFLDADPSEITKAGSIMNDSGIKKALAELDVKIVRGEVQTADYAPDSALEEMSDTMQSKAISRLAAETKVLKERLAHANEQIRGLRADLKVYEARDKSLLENNIKGGSIH